MKRSHKFTKPCDTRLYWTTFYKIYSEQTRNIHLGLFKKFHAATQLGIVHIIHNKAFLCIKYIHIQYTGRYPTACRESFGRYGKRDTIPTSNPPARSLWVVARTITYTCYRLPSISLKSFNSYREANSCVESVDHNPELLLLYWTSTHCFLRRNTACKSHVGTDFHV
jgi:hypothetical protein